jgi:hypothetical protein
MDTERVFLESVRVVESGRCAEIQVRLDDSVFPFAIYGDALKHDAERILRRAVRQGARPVGEFTIAFEPGEDDKAHVLAQVIRHALKRIAKRPIEQNRVEAALKISHKECNRWTKDGRLRTSGTLVVSRAPTLRIQRSTYAPDVIADLAAHPERIDAWRAEDLGRL